jgi:hypothetical protein
MKARLFSLKEVGSDSNSMQMWLQGLKRLFDVTSSVNLVLVCSYPLLQD